MKLPNFLFIGPDKAGSSWLHKALRQHDDVYMPKAKELFFFDKFYGRGWDWYGHYFADCTENHKIIGEVSHDYLFSSIACERIKRDLPQVKLMVSLREPAQRAFSAYLYMVKQGRVTSDFETALEQIDELIDHGRYGKHLRPYLEFFGRNRIHIAIFDDLVANPQDYFESICDFLEIKRQPLSNELKSKANPAMYPRFKYIGGWARKTGWWIRSMGMPGLVGWVKESAVIRRLLYREYDIQSKPEMNEDVRNYIRSRVASDVQQLDAMLGTDLYKRWGYPD